MVLDGFEGGGEDLADHETLGQIIFEELVDLAVEEGAELLYFEGGVVEDSHSQLELLLAVHLIIFLYLFGNYYPTLLIVI